MEPRINLALSKFMPCEQLYLKFVYDEINLRITNKVTPIFIEASKSENARFKAFVEKNYKDHFIGYNVKITLYNVWKKVKIDVEKALDPTDFENEKKCQSTAYGALIYIGRFGQVLTLRQANLFTFYAKMLKTPFCKSFTTKYIPPLTNNEKLYLGLLFQKDDKPSSKDDLRFFDGGVSTQIAFTVCTHLKHGRTKEDDNLMNIIDSLVYRAQAELKRTLDPMYVADEKRMQMYAEEESLLREDEGRVLTHRQIEILRSWDSF